MTASQAQLIKSLQQMADVFAASVRTKDLVMPFDPHKTAIIAGGIAGVMGMDAEKAAGVRIGATLLDVGMMNIPAGILNKPGKLTDAEYEIVKQHPVHGFQILRGIEFPWPVGRMVLQHHERLDGTGYPGALADTDILLEARIMAVADTVSAMTSERSYRKALPVDAALGELRAHRGGKYDATVVDATIELYTNQKHRLDEH